MNRVAITSMTNTDLFFGWKNVPGNLDDLAYRLVHEEAHLNEAEKRRLIDGLVATTGRL